MKRRFVAVAALLFSCHAAIDAHADGDPGSRSHVPDYFVVVGRVSQGAAPDPVGLATVTMRNFANEPIVNTPVTLDLSGCCDIAICEAVANGAPAPIDGAVISGTTNAQGQVTFILMGAARDPGTRIPPDQYGGGASNAMLVRGDFQNGKGMVAIDVPTVVCLDQNGAAGQSNGTTVSDVGNVINVFGSIGLGAPYKGRADINQDGNITIGDVGTLLGHVGRLVLQGGVGCVGPYPPGSGCP